MRGDAWGVGHWRRPCVVGSRAPPWSSRVSGVSLMLSAACCPCSCPFRACCGLAVSRLIPYVPCGVCPSPCWPVTLLDVISAKRPSQAVPRSDPHVTFFQPGRAHELARRPIANGVVRGRALDQAARGSRRVSDRERGSAGGDRGLLLADVCAHAARALQRWARRVSWLSSWSVPCRAAFCAAAPSRRSPRSPSVVAWCARPPLTGSARVASVPKVRPCAAPCI